MVSALDLTGLTNIGSGAVVVLIVISILRGWLVPKSTMRDRMQDKDFAIQGLRRERDDWKATAQTKDATIQLLSSQLDEALESARFSTAVVRAIPKAASRDD